MNVEWIKALTELLRSFAWPATVVALVWVFRREIRQRIASLKEVKYPGGSVTMEVKRLEERVESSLTTTSVAPALNLNQELRSSLQDPLIAMAESRIEIERELFRLSLRALDHSTVTHWPIQRIIDEMASRDVVSKDFASNIRDFIEITNKVIHGTEVPQETTSRALDVGRQILSALRHKRVVSEAEYDFGGGHWHPRKQRAESKKYFWSVLASQLPSSMYDYDLYKEAAQNYNSRVDPDANIGPCEKVPILDLEDFVTVLMFREKELFRLIAYWNNGNGWQAFEKANEWKWPEEWGELRWNCPIIRENVSLLKAKEDLMQTTASLERHRARLRRGGHAQRPQNP